MQQFKALSNKNFILFRRNKISSILQFVIPIGVALFLIFVRHLANRVQFPQEQFLRNNQTTKTIYGMPMPSIEEDPDKVGPVGQQTAPNYLCNNKPVAFIKDGGPFQQKLKTILQDVGYRIKQFDSDEQIDSIIRNEDYQQSRDGICFGLSFQNSGNDYKYYVRFNLSNHESPKPDNEIDQSVDPWAYESSMNSGFFQIVTTINNLIMQDATNNQQLIFVHKVGMIHQEPTEVDSLYEYLKTSGEFMMVFPLLYNFLKQTSSMLEEKEKRIRQSMSISGMKTWIYYFTWFLRFFSVYVIVHLIVSGIVVSQLPHVPYYIPFVMFLLFDILLIVQSFFIQVFVTRAKVGIVLALVVFTVQYAINFAVANSDGITYDANRSISVIAHVAFILSFKQMFYAESINQTLNFGTFLNNYTINTAIVSIVGNIFVWGILALYLQQVFPNEFGAKKHPFFCFKSLFRKCSNKNKSKVQESIVSGDTNQSAGILNSDAQTAAQMSSIEEVQQRYKQMQKTNKCIAIDKLYKTFDGKNYAVNGLSMKIYSDQIFVLLGHNGAGKTTTISMLTGMVKQTSGTISILGQTDLGKIREKIGICPQHDTLYSQLTVEQHVRLYANLRGKDDQSLEKQIDILIEDVNLQEKRNQFSKDLSGGQKRRLSVAMAFSGNAQVIILDQPTSGMDTSARRYIWDMLKNYRKDRIIILTTHFMDEADYLGDRIAIMASGKLAALGSNVFLKNKFGAGYNMTVSRSSKSLSSKPMLRCIQSHIQNMRVLSDFSTQTTIQLPIEEIGSFHKMFQQLDSRKEQFGIVTYGISITTLQDVFLKVAQKQSPQTPLQIPAHQTPAAQQSHPQPPSSLSSSNPSTLTIPIATNPLHLTPSTRVPSNQQSTESHSDPQTFSHLKRQSDVMTKFNWHFKATILKRLRVMKRDYKSFLFELILPMAIIVLALLLMRITFDDGFPIQNLSFGPGTDGVPVQVPISAAEEEIGLANRVKNIIDQRYEGIVQTNVFVYDTDLDFDQDVLFPMKLRNQKAKGGIYFSPEEREGPFTLIPFTTIVNTQAPSSFGSLQTLAAESYINTLLPEDSQISITLVSKPLPLTTFQNAVKNNIIGFFAGVIFSIALSFKFASMVAFIVKQKSDRSKHQQIISGMNIYSYWLGTYLYDFILYFIIAAFAAGMCQALQIQLLIKDTAFGAVCLLLLLFGFANIPLTYLLGYLFVDYGNAQAAIYFFNFICGGGFSVIVLIFRWMNQNSNQISRGFAWPLRVIPAFAFGEGLMNIGSIRLLQIYQTSGLHPFGLEVALGNIIFLAIFGSVFLSLVFVFEFLQNHQGFMRWFNRDTRFMTETNPVIRDSDVQQQRKLALESTPEQYEILAKNLKKVYPLHGGSFKVAVNGVSFGVRKGEVFGLLGVNGAGKSTTFKMLSGEVVSTSGQSYFSGIRTDKNLQKIRQNLGYCPQFDAIIDGITVKEQLELFYDMKSLPREVKEDVIQKKIVQMDLEKYRDKLSGTLSGGNKRKLSVAMAMIGNPGIIFLDQPSTGMDPKTRRFMWKVISKITKQRKQSTVILTTHAMDEAESLSSRLGIMVSGNFRCMGTPQHIKSKYGDGFEIEFKIKQISPDQISAYLAGTPVEVSEVTREQLPKFMQQIGAMQYLQEIRKTGSGHFIWQEHQQGHKVSAFLIVEYILTQQRMRNVLETLRQNLGQTEPIEQYHTYMCVRTSQKSSVGVLFQLLESNKDKLSIVQYGIRQSTIEQIFNRFAQEGEREQKEREQEQGQRGEQGRG